MSFYDQLKFNADGLIPAIIQDAPSKRVLMMAWMNRASLESTLATGKTHFWSRSRQKFWMKGESSGHTQSVKDISFDCDGDTLLIQVEQVGAACHEGYRSCFFRSVEGAGPDLILLDLNLPRKDGREVLAELKSDANFRRIPVVVLTTSQSDEDVLRAYNLNANCYVSKPVDLDQFIKVVRGIEDFWLTIVKLPAE